jgi:radical SAM-linked protein
MRLSEAPLAYSQGFNPQPRIALSPPLPLGFEGLGELADVFLTARVDVKTWLSRLREIRIEGLDWTGAEEIPLQAPAIQQAIESYEYLVAWRLWGKDSPLLPLESTDLQEAINGFMNAEERIIELERKGGMQKRDARAFVEAFDRVTPPPPYTTAIRISIRSENGRTLSPLLILRDIAGGPPEQGLMLRVARLPLIVPEGSDH